MAINNRKSAAITARDASPQTLVTAGIASGMLRAFAAVVAAVNADSATSVYRMFQVQSNAVVHSLKMACVALGAGAKFDIGVYDTVPNGGAVVSANVFAAALDVSGAVALTEYRFSALAIGTIEQELWQLLGLSKDPAKQYDICITVNVAMAASGNAILMAQTAF